MFEQGAVLLPPAAATGPHGDDVVWPPEEELDDRLASFDACLAAEDAGDLWVVRDGRGPVRATALDSSTLLAWAEEDPLATETVQLLEGVDPASLNREERLRLIALCHRLEARIDALKLTAIAAYAGPEPDRRGLGGIEERNGEPDFTDCDVAAACRTSSVGGQRLVSLARDLAYRLPRTRSLLREGQISHGHVLAMSELTTSLTADQCARVEQLALCRAPDQSPGQFRVAVRRAVTRVDSDALTRKEKAARTETRIDTWHDQDGHGGAEVRGPSADIALIETWVESYARRAKAAGDPRSLKALRFAGLVAACEARLTGQTPGPRRPSTAGRSWST